MFKTLTTTLMLTVASCSMSPAYAGVDCTTYGNNAMKVAKARDIGVLGGDVYEVLVNSGMNKQEAYEMVYVIYTTGRNDPPELVGNIFYSICEDSHS